MELKKGFKQTELGILPLEWSISKITEVADYVDYRGKTPTKAENGILLVTAKNIRDGYIDYKISEEYILESVYEQAMSRGKPEIGDVLITTEAPLGMVASVDREDIALAQRVIKYRGHKEKIHNSYLKYFFLSPYFKQKLDENSIGSTAKGIKGSVLHQLPVALPPKKEQEAIANALSDADAYVESLEKLITKKRLIKKGVMQELLTGKRRLPGYEKSSAKRNTEIGIIPSDWIIERLGTLGSFKNGINKDSEAFGHGFPFVNLMDVFGYNVIKQTGHLGLLETNSFERSTYDLKTGDVLFIRSSVKPSGVGLTVLIADNLPDAVYSGFLIRFRDNGAIHKEYKKYCFYEEGFRNRLVSSSSVSANTNINQNSLAALTLALPSEKAEQVAIAQIISDMDFDIVSNEGKLAKARLIKQGMMQELLTGRIRLV